jgi:2-hydroxychromene-2-carboxylate isomerase
MQPEFHFDFGSPNAYLSHLVIPAIEARTGVRFRYVPVLLGGVFKLTNNRSPMEAFAGVKNKNEYHALETARFIKAHGITDYKRNPDFPINTLQIMRGACAAEDLGCFAGYVDAVFRHMWADPKKMDEPGVIAAALAASGLPAALMERAQATEAKARLFANTEASVARGVFGSPSFFVGDALYFGKDRLPDVEAAITAGS